MYIYIFIYIYIYIYIHIREMLRFKITREDKDNKCNMLTFSVVLTTSSDLQIK